MRTERTEPQERLVPPDSKVPLESPAKPDPLVSEARTEPRVPQDGEEAKEVVELLAFRDLLV